MNSEPSPAHPSAGARVLVSTSSDHTEANSLRIFCCWCLLGLFFAEQVAPGEVQGARVCGRPVPDLGADGLHLASPRERRYPATPGREVDCCVAFACCRGSLCFFFRGRAKRHTMPVRRANCNRCCRGIAEVRGLCMGAEMR